MIPSPVYNDEIEIRVIKQTHRFELAKLDHVHSPEGRCFKRRAAMLCEDPK